MTEISESIKKRIELVKSADDIRDLKKYLCPFFKEGGCKDCLGCTQTDKDLEDCKEQYLSGISTHPMDIWNPDFDKVAVVQREKITLQDAKQFGIRCDTCYMYDKCPYYMAGYICKIDWGSGKPQTAKEMYDFLIDLQYQRVRRSAVFEQADGGVPDAGLSGEMDRLDCLIAGRANLDRESLSLNVTATGSSSSEGGGILAKIFGGGSSKPALEDKPKEPIEIPAVTDADFEEVKSKPTKRRKSKEAKNEQK